MAITKTDFINYTRCRRYVALEELKSEKLDADITYEEYKNAEQEAELQEILDTMLETNEEGEEIDHTEVVNRQLEAMMPYYKRVEEEAGKLVVKVFGGNTIYAEKTKDQVSFDYSLHGIHYLCYVDVYNETDDAINIIEVKATTSKKYEELEASLKARGGEKYPIFLKQGNIFTLKGEIPGYPLEQEMSLENYEAKREKLFNRYGIGKYTHDLAVQRMMIEGELEENPKGMKKPIHYYLAVLNSKYIFDGTYENGRAVYNPDEDGNELIAFFQMDGVTEEYQKFIRAERECLERYIEEMDVSKTPLGPSCGMKTYNVCKFFKPTCGSFIPEKNSSLSYMNNGFGFLKEDGTRIKGLELINEGYIHLLDVPEEWITRPNHKIQRECTENHTVYVNREKIAAAIKDLKYPIYHLDFETMPCPVPRFKGEWPYIQSPFEFSLHIESAPGVCDKQKDNVIFLAETTGDEREEMIELMLKYMDPDKGTLFAQNVGFEKGRIKELAHMFPEYREPLLKLRERGYDLLWLVNNNKELYKSLGFEGEDIETMNYYNEKLGGSFSIKKTLPVFSDLSYKNLVVKNGTEAIVEYANYDKMSKEELALKKEALRIYCQQDTWAMVEILQALRELVAEEPVK